jgi:predicted signal transduction protein with EAL and GGDEF domain
LVFILSVATLFERTLVWIGWIITLGRTILLGVVGRTMRVTLQEQSVGVLKQRDQSLERANAELQHQATHDPLTGLANRVLFANRLKEMLATQTPLNDSLGYGARDALLKLVGLRLRLRVPQCSRLIH